MEIRGRRPEGGLGWNLGCAAVLLFICAACSQPGEEGQVRNAVNAFYEVYLKVRPSGVPNKAQLVEFKKVISADLANLLNQASLVEDTASGETTSASPPRIEGDLFTSTDEGAISYKTAQCETEKAPVACIVELTNVDDRNKAKLEWKDRVYLVREDNRWVVDDIEFLGERVFMHKGRLKNILKQVIEEGKDPTV